MAWIFTSDGNYVNFNGGGNLWRLHKDSNCISWHWDDTGDLFFDVYDQEYTVKAGNIADVVIDGVPLSAASDFPTAITAVFTGIGAASYLVYTALLTQTGTGNPVITELGNTLGNPVVIVRNTGGIYDVTCSGQVFNEAKTTLSISNNYNFYNIFVNLFGGSLQIQTYSNGIAAADDQLNMTMIEIRVYP